MPSRQYKRPRRSSSSGSDDKHAEFTYWAKQRGVVINGVCPAELPGRGIGLVTTRHVKEDDRLIFVPVRAMIVPSKMHQDNPKLSPQAQLVATLMHMASIKDPGYTICRKVWPTESDFASSLWWHHRSLQRFTDSELLPQTSVRALRRLEVDCGGDFHAINGRHFDHDAAVDSEYLYLWTIANTRSFSFKPAGRKRGLMVLCPFLDYMNHCPSEQGCEVKITDEGYSLYADRDYAIGEEILATYGAHTNDKLLVHYGFSVPNSKDDLITLDEAIIPHLRDFHIQDLESVGYLGNYTLNPNTLEICFRTQVALRSTLATSNEWEFFMHSGEDIGDDFTVEVQTQLVKWLTDFKEKIIATKTAKLRKVLNGMEGAAHAAVLLQIARWAEIKQAMCRYIEDSAATQLNGKA